MKNFPKYVSDRGHGEVSYEVPLMISGITAYSFLLSVDRDQVQAFIDEQLNVVSGGVVKFTALPFVFHCYFDATHCTSSSEVIGYLPDRECAFLIPLLQWREGELLPKLKFWVPYLLIDRMAGMVTGREVWGYRKALGEMVVPLDPDHPAYFSGSTMLFKTLSPQTEGKWEKLVQIQGGSKRGELEPRWENYEQALNEILEKVAKEIGDAALAAARLTEDVLAPLFGKPHFPVVNLKQFRDAVDSTKACYQAIVESPCQLETWQGGGILDGDYKLKITTCESHQVVKDLGLGQPGPDYTEVPIKFGVWIKMAFSTLDGSIVWEAS